jgi:hypothetical protein
MKILTELATRQSFPPDNPVRKEGAVSQPCFPHFFNEGRFAGLRYL